MKTPPSNQEKLDEMYDLMIELKKDTEFMMKEMDDMHITLNWIRRRERIRFFSNMIYWAVILGITFGAYYYIQPLLDGILGGLGGGGILKSLENGVGKLNDLKNMQELINGGASSTLE